MMHRHSQRGSAMLITMVLIAALLAGTAVLVSLQLKSSRSTEITRTGITALHCAEGGLAAARKLVEANKDKWNDAGVLGGGQPSWLTGAYDDDVNDDGTGGDVTVTLVDNVDETPDDPTQDKDDIIVVISTCNLYSEQRTQVREIVKYNAAGYCYNAQLGGCGGNGNTNQ